ncbi:MAG: class II fumarate hydratase [Gammaproteobacteria bacterium]|nr:class II fumarate hydratase [Gammaproteobacteria bacterium]NIR98885.1 class II fumarate hydratase [Gammaproteobacteria bacterium]NIT64006.1 class II fumarate hydratase [Gammaproteobacteria bacterium]NIV19166.1 aspartate ammonia-lyase [Gammaproteobacteria bacterium]NIX10335.1 aspartate ammonia-lyase [Gammaproteobacteria bacterium]
MAADDKYRVERDSLGEVRVPAEALYGAQTQRAVDNFPVSGLTMPRPFLRALGAIKACAAQTNAELGELEAELAEAVAAVAAEVEAGTHDGQFPVDVFQTGSGTSTNMNANEVIATLAARRLGRSVHPNDHVNRGQSSNDVIPTAIHVSARLALHELLLPALDGLAARIGERAGELDAVVKTGRTHLMDATPLTLGQELGGWEAQVRQGAERLQAVVPRLGELAQGGTAVGTGINAHPDFAARFVERLSRHTGLEFTPARNRFAALAAQDTAVELSGQLRALAVALMKITNDLRWMNSGPLAGLAEISLPALQPGSSIMPGKVNPVIPEAVAMVCAQVMGNDATVAVAGQSGSFQLNVMLPVIAHNLLQSIELLANGARLLGEAAIRGFEVNHRHVAERLGRNPILVTALNERIGYEKAAEIAQRAYAEGRPVHEVAAEVTGMDAAELARLLDPARLTGPRR